MPICGTNMLKFSTGSVSGATLDVYFLNVGQGNFVIVRFPNGTYMMVDAGVTSGGPGLSAIQKNVDTVLGKNKFSTVVITHPDGDHNNLIPDIKQAQKPDKVHISSDKIEYADAIQTWFDDVEKQGGEVLTYKDDYYHHKPDPDFDSGDCNVYILAANVKGDKNTGSIVLSIDYHLTTVLLTGDATSTTERFIMKNWHDGAIASHMLSFGHHGSNHSSSKYFLKSVKPGAGIFSASSYHGGYGHPRCEIIDLVEKLVNEGGKDNCTLPMHRLDCWNTKRGEYVCERNNLGVFLTATQGNIKFTTDGDLYEVWIDGDTSPCPP